MCYSNCRNCFSAKNVFKFIGISIVIFIGIALIGFVVMWLWNALIPDLFHGPHISYWQAFGLLILSKLLFKGGWHKGHHSGKGMKGWSAKMRRKMASMTPEEREAFQSKLRDCFWDEKKSEF